MRLPAIKHLLRPLPLLEIFMVGNVAFLALDIYIAHAVNDFRHPGEWIPIYFSIIAAPLYAMSLVFSGLDPGPNQPRTGARRFGRALGSLVGWGCLAVGIAGLLYHLESQFFQLQTIKSLVYTAPFIAPLAYTGMGLVLLLNRMVDSRTIDWGRWVVLLAAGGFIGNFVLCLCDHAQNGFYVKAEWIGVIAGAVAVGMLVAVVVVPNNRPLIRLGYLIMLAQIFVGTYGAVLHVKANVYGPSRSVWDNFVFGAPAFAPLLFADLAILGLLGLWGLERVLPDEARVPATASPLPAS
jgi:hypothetical protein